MGSSAKGPAQHRRLHPLEGARQLPQELRASDAGPEGQERIDAVRMRVSGQKGGLNVGMRRSPEAAFDSGRRHMERVEKKESSSEAEPERAESLSPQPSKP